jgi:putative SOS response-associated peptidase YedK
MKDGSPFAFAGLWERWERGEEPVETCTLITTEANGEVRRPLPLAVIVLITPADVGMGSVLVSMSAWGQS